MRRLPQKHTSEYIILHSTILMHSAVVIFTNALNDAWLCGIT